MFEINEVFLVFVRIFAVRVVRLTVYLQVMLFLTNVDLRVNVDDVLFRVRRVVRIANVHGNGIYDRICFDLAYFPFFDHGSGGAVHATKAVGYHDQNVFWCDSVFGVHEVRDAWEVLHGLRVATARDQLYGFPNKELQSVVGGVRELIVSAR